MGVLVKCLLTALLLNTCCDSWIIPDEITSLLSLIYSNIPPIKKGSDSRVGVGFSLGRHADAQVVLELGPQIYTEPLGNSASRRRQATDGGAIGRRRDGTAAPYVPASPQGWLGRWSSGLRQNGVSTEGQKAVEGVQTPTRRRGIPAKDVTAHLHQLFVNNSASTPASKATTTP